MIRAPKLALNTPGATLCLNQSTEHNKSISDVKNIVAKLLNLYCVHISVPIITLKTTKYLSVHQSGGATLPSSAMPLRWIKIMREQRQVSQKT